MRCFYLGISPDLLFIRNSRATDLSGDQGRVLDSLALRLRPIILTKKSTYINIFQWINDNDVFE